MHEKLNNARIMCNQLKYKHSIKNNVGQGGL